MPHYYHANTLGSTISLTNSTGNVVEAYRYSAYGQADHAGSLGNPYFFTGRELDSETGLYYYRARYYDASLIRFLQPDPIGYRGGMNLYTYVHNSPVNWIDPFGEQYRPNYRPYPSQRPEPSKPLNETSVVPKPKNAPTPEAPGTTPPPKVTPENYNPDGINNMPDQEMPKSNTINRNKSMMTSVFNALAQIFDILKGGGSIGLPIISIPALCQAIPTLPQCQGIIKCPDGV